MGSCLLDMFAAQGAAPQAILDWMDASSYDEMFEVDVPNNRCYNIYHVEGKYHVPVFDSTFTGLFDYAIECMVHPDDREKFDYILNPETIFEHLEQSKCPGVIGAQYRYRLQNGGWRWTESFVFSGEQFGIAPGVARCYIFDIQNQKDREDGKRFTPYYELISHRDDKTGLHWEKEFFDNARETLGDLDPAEISNWCIVAIDLDHFRLFNDWYTRSTGDLLLARMGKQLLEIERSTGGVAGYFGQDDFCIVMPYSEVAVADLRDKLGGLFDDLTTVKGFKPLFGVCMLDAESPLFDQYDRAKMALDSVRYSFKTDINMFDSKMKETSDHEYQVLLDFHHGIVNREFKVYLQPQCRVSSGKVVGVEALARWVKDDGTVISPAEFIPVLEKHGFMADLDRYIWEEVCINLRAWLDAGHDAVPCSVNVSQADFYSMDVVAVLQQLVEKYQIPKSLLKVEITESTFASSADEVADVTMRLREAGFAVLMDDFGSGYSSLNMLGTLNVDTIKLDAAFFRMDGAGKRKSIRIVESIISMAKNMGMPIICEGVETQDQVDFLDSLGCRFIQGFYYYRPMPADELEKLLGDGAMIDHRGFVEKANREMAIRELLDQNVYSDAMLNRILGPVAFYLWRDKDGDGDEVDIVRFNELFYEEVGTPQFHDRLHNVDKMLVPEDQPRMLDMFRRAMEDELNGAGGTLCFQEYDGTNMRFWLHFYYMGEAGEGKLFFASVRNVSAEYESRINRDILSKFVSSSVVFMRRQGDAWRFKVVIHGLRDEMGVSEKQFQAELDDLSFYDRFDLEELQKLQELARTSFQEKRDFTFPFKMTDGAGQFHELELFADHVPEEIDGVSYILAVREAPRESHE